MKNWDSWSGQVTTVRHEWAVCHSEMPFSWFFHEAQRLFYGFFMHFLISWPLAADAVELSSDQRYEEV
jgi:hypothetical protein